MLRAAAPIAIAAGLYAGGVTAQTGQPPRQQLFEALRLDDVVKIMHEEGLAYGEVIEMDLFPGRGGPLWRDTVADIYDRSEMMEAVRETFSEALPEPATPPLLDYFTTQPGARFVDLELAARRAMADPETEYAAIESARDAAPARADLVSAFIEANDLVEQNVSGALNSNFAFYRGLADGGAPIRDLSEEQIIADVWASEPQIRFETIDWLEAYLTMAYAPMTDDEVASYVDLSLSEEGQDLNAAIFAAFDTLYDDISYELGRAAAAYMMSEDL